MNAVYSFGYRNHDYTRLCELSVFKNNMLIWYLALSYENCARMTGVRFAKEIDGCSIQIMLDNGVHSSRVHGTLEDGRHAFDSISAYFYLELPTLRKLLASTDCGFSL